MRMAGFWVVLNLVDLLCLGFLFWRRKMCLICSVHSEAFLQSCRVEECSITWSTLLYSSVYIITGEAG